MIWSNVTTTNGTTSSTTESTTISSKSTKEKDAKESSTPDVNDFLSLLVTEMQYQDPLEPTDNSQYIAQMAREKLGLVKDNEIVFEEED